MTKRAAAIGGACLVLLAVGRALVGSPPAPAEVTSTAAVRSTPSPTAPPLPDPPVAGAVRGPMVSYAVAVPELHGLPPQAAPGTELEIWVAWEPPVTKRPDIRRLLESAVLEEISPPLLPDGPHVAMLLVPRKDFSDLLYGDRYGSLSVAIPQRSSAGS